LLWILNRKPAKITFLSQRITQESVVKFDIVIVGAGIVGSLFANLISKTPFPLRIALIDKSLSTATVPANIDPRVSAITRQSEACFQSLSIWELLCNSQRISFYEEMFVWDGEGSGSIHFDCKTREQTHLGSIIENILLQKILIERLKTQENVTFFDNCTVTDLTLDGATPSVTLSNGEILTAKLIIGADGAHSKVREYAGINITEKPYHHHALVCHATTTLPHKKTAYQRFTPHGSLAFLPLIYPNQSSIVWSAPPEFIQKNLALNETAFHHALGCAFEFKLGKITDTTQRLSFPLIMRHANTYLKPGVALIGDAAHTIHPLAGQGVNLGIADALCLAKNIEFSLQKHVPFESHSRLRAFERERKAQNALMIAGMQGFKQLFTDERLSVQMLRNIGLNLCDKSSKLKNLFIKIAGS
jgi:2-polyprenylphenol 6-hydroxylase